MLAFTMMAAICHRTHLAPSKKQTAGPRQKPQHRYAVIDPMVNPASPPHHHQARSQANPTMPISSHGHSGAGLTGRPLSRAHFKAKRQLYC